MTYVLGIDVETTGLDPEKDEIIELGMVLWDWEKKTPVQIFNEYVGGEKEIPEHIETLTGISNTLRETRGWAKDSIKRILISNMLSRPLLMAYNAKFDSAFIHKLTGNKYDWLCAMEDVDYPEHIQTRKLSYLAAEYGFVNPFAHRAVFDVLTMFEIVKNFDLQKIVDNSRQPKMEIVAQVSYSEREKAKTLGYRWENSSWIKLIRENQFEEEREKAKLVGFLIRDKKSKLISLK